MPVPNVSTLYQRINKGSEGGNEFARFIRLLLSADYHSQGKYFVSESDASGDYKHLDAYISLDKDFPELISGFQFKFFPSKLSDNQKKEVEDSIEKALTENEYIQEFILVTPEDFQKEQQAWFEKLKKKFDQSYWLTSDSVTMECSFTLTHWGHLKIIELSLKHDHLGSQYFPELFPMGMGIGKFKLAEAMMDCENSNWLPFENNPFGFHQSYSHSRNELTSDPVFDFHFANSSPEIFLLKKIEIELEKITTQVKGIPSDYLLKSIGTIQYEVDFSKKINSIDFNDPIIIEAKSPKRFKLQLLNFTNKCPGNCVLLKFWFHFNNYSIPTNSFYLSF